MVKPLNNVRSLRGKTLIHKLLTEVFQCHLFVKNCAFKMVDLASVYRHEGNFFIANHLIQRVFDFQERKFINSQLDNDAQVAWRDILEDFCIRFLVFNVFNQVYIVIDCFVFTSAGTAYVLILCRFFLHI
jgi:hypothetical protein